MSREGWRCEEGDPGLEDSPQHGPFSSKAWLDAVTALAGGEALELRVLKGDETAAGLRAWIRNGPAGREACPPPFGYLHTPFLRPATDPRAERRSSDALGALDALAESLESHLSAARLVLHPTLQDVRPFQWRGWKATVRYTWQVPLGDPAAAQAQCADDVKQAVRKAEQLGVEISPSGDLGEATDLWISTAARQGIRPEGSRAALLAFFGRLSDAGLLRLWTARRAGEPLAAVWLLKSPGWAGYWLAANAQEGLKSGANALLIWRLMESLSPEGGVLDLCGADHPSISHFKGKFGGRLVARYEVEHAGGLRARLRRAIS